MKARIGAALPVVIGEPIPFGELAAIRDRQALSDRLHDATYALAVPEWVRPRLRKPSKPLRLGQKAA